ncbi:unnamed protein product [Dicrocoelium dendriticum]|nr:unnamed protein product [Dicrocoelium dendriticum]
MATNFVKSIPIHLYHAKQNVNRKIDRVTEKLLVERLCRPTYASLQSHLPPSGKTQPHPLATKRDKSLRSPDESRAQQQKAQHHIESPSSVRTEYTELGGTELKEKEISIITSPPLFSSSTRIPFSIDDKSLLGVQSSSTCICYCPKGAAILEEESQRWLRESPYYQMKMNSRISTWGRYRPIEASVGEANVNELVNRLYSTKTISASLREKESHRLLSKLRPQLPVRFKKPCPLGSSFDLPSPNRPEFFDESGDFKVDDFFRCYNRSNAMAERMRTISRPTIGSKLKHKGVCAVCDDNPKESLTFRSVRTKRTIRGKKGQDALNQRLLQPTVSSMTHLLMCIRAGEWKQTEFEQMTTRSNFHYYSGEADIRGPPHSATEVPLISGLQRSSSVRSITQRVYSGKCRRRNCQSNERTTRVTRDPVV